MNINQCSKRIKSKREGITYPLFFIETAKKFRGFLSKRRKRKKSSPSGSSFQVKFIWSSNEAHLILGRMYLKLRRDVSGAASGRICYCVGTYQMLRRDAISGTALEIIREKQHQKHRQKSPKTLEYRYFYGNIWQIMAIKKLLQYRDILIIKQLTNYMAILLRKNIKVLS